MTTLTAAYLAGMAGTDSDQGGKEIWNKATTGGSLIRPGKIAFLVEATGIGRVAGAGDSGRMGIIPKDSPNTDADAQFAVYVKPGTEAYAIVGASTLKPGCRVMPGPAGVAIIYAAGATNADFGLAPFVYVGHYGEGSSYDQKATDATVGQAVRLRHL